MLRNIRALETVMRSLTKRLEELKIKKQLKPLTQEHFKSTRILDKLPKLISFVPRIQLKFNDM